MLSRRKVLSGIAFVFVSFSQTIHAADDPKAVEFFEAKIRPVLNDHCFKCHSDEAEKSKKLRGGLKLDSRAGWQKGGDTGPAVIPGKPDEGTLIKSLRYHEEPQMPPKGKLPDAVIRDFETWVKNGAADPRETVAEVKAAATIDFEKRRQFWSFQPPKPQTVPAGTGAAKVSTPIDAFIQTTWKEKGLTPTSVADKRTLIRRLTFDLTGLPPSSEEVESFVKDTSPDAWAKRIDKLMATPQYGERWGRYWLDVARYAEDQAHTFEVTPKKYAYLYRDWVIKAFNDDMPYDKFVKLQIAGDLVKESEGDLFTRLAGLGLMGLGADYYKNTAREQAIAEELDDRVDTLTRGFLGLTVSCARCHDHKFDPIPTQDYYSIAGIYYGTNMASTPLVPKDVLDKYNQAQDRVKAAEELVTTFLKEVGITASKSAAASTAKYLDAAWAVRTTKKPSKEIAKKEGLNQYFLDRWIKFLDPANAEKAPAMFKEWFALKADAKAEEVHRTAEAIQAKLIAVELPAITAAAPAKGNKGKAKDGADPLTKAMFLNPNAPLLVAPAEAETMFITAEAKPKLMTLREEVEDRKKASPPAPIKAHVISGNGQGMSVYIRGNPATKGDKAPKGFLHILKSADEQPAKEYTRLDLANSIASPENPLTARVIVNRVWSWHFGRGLVNTPSNFGSLGDRPSHPELLDYLTVEFVKHGWSVKWLNKQILLSTVYQLDSEGSVENNKIDAANVYLWRGTRKRLDVEAWRDSLLAVSGQLDSNIGGPSFSLRDANAKRRTVYAVISRHEPDGLLRMFDFPDANVTADKRNITTVPQQQLFALNSEFMIIQAKSFAARLEKSGKSDEERIEAAYRLAYNRKPEADEVELGTKFLKSKAKPEDKLTRLQQYAQAILASNEFLYVD